MSHVFDLDPEFLTLYERCREQTLTSIERMYALYGAVQYIVDNDLPGDIVECGVWRGGSMMLAALLLAARNRTDRDLWLYDTFQGMTPPTDADIQTMTGTPARTILAAQPRTTDDPFWGIAPRTVVEQNLRSTTYPSDRIHFVEGDITTTLPTHSPTQIALLRLDTDWYTSTRHELEHLYPRVTPRGVVIIDDYGYWEGARRATDEYFASRGEKPLLFRIDFTGRMLVKP